MFHNIIFNVHIFNELILGFQHLVCLFHVTSCQKSIFSKDIHPCLCQPCKCAHDRELPLGTFAECLQNIMLRSLKLLLTNAWHYDSVQSFLPNQQKVVHCVASWFVVPADLCLAGWHGHISHSVTCLYIFTVVLCWHGTPNKDFKNIKERSCCFGLFPKCLHEQWYYYNTDE